MPLPLTADLAAELHAVAETLRRSTVAVLAAAPGPHRRAAAGQGSGIVWTADGLVVTNAHVARGDAAVVVLHDGRRLPAALVARDPRRDLAVLRVDAQDLVPALRGDPASARPGELVLAFGHPLGARDVLSVGILHRTDHASRATPPGHLASGGLPRWGGHLAGVATLAADVRLRPGNSGGPLTDARGRVLGVNTLVAGGLGVAVSAVEVEGLLAQLAAGHAPGTAAGHAPARHRCGRGRAA